jgi:iron complex transport system permease protein
VAGALAGEALMAAQTVKTPWVTVRLPFVSFRLDRRVPPVFVLVGLFGLAVLVGSIGTGEYPIAPLEVVQTLTGTLDPAHPDARNLTLVIFTFRLPRIVVAFLVGMALAVSGAIMQGVTRNPLADPYLLGVSGGAGVAAVVLIVWFGGAMVSLLPFGALAGGLLTAMLVYGLAWQSGGSAPMRLILIGVAVSAVVGAVTTVLLLFGNINQVQQAYVWLVGSVYGRTWEHVHALSAWLVVLVPLAFLGARGLNLLGMGDDVARSLGVRVEVLRLGLMAVATALASAAVAVAGTVGFVGLVAPHITRRLVGPTHEGVLPISAMVGGVMLVLADWIGRAVIAPSELPIGIVTAMLGAPYFLYLLIRERRTA